MRSNAIISILDLFTPRGGLVLDPPRPAFARRRQPRRRVHQPPPRHSQAHSAVTPTQSRSVPTQPCPLPPRDLALRTRSCVQLL